MGYVKMIKWFEEFKKNIEVSKRSKAYEEDYNKETHKECLDCEGTGLEDVFGECAKCEGTGVVKKTYQEIHNLKPYKKNI
jgi:RecJ-like exonuclease